MNPPLDTNPIVNEAVQSPVIPISQQNQPITTELISIEPQNPYEVLDPIRRAIVDYRLSSLPYKLIQKEIKELYGKEYLEQSLRWMFCVKGPCYSAYQYMQEQRESERDARQDRIGQQFHQTAEDAIGIMRKGLLENNITNLQLEIANNILDRAGWPKTAKLESRQEIRVEESRSFTEAIVAIAESVTK